MIPILTHCNVLLSGFWYIWLTKGGLMYVSRALTEVISCKLKKPKPPHSCLHQMIIFVSCQVLISIPFLVDMPKEPRALDMVRSTYSISSTAGVLIKPSFSDQIFYIQIFMSFLFFEKIIEIAFNRSVEVSFIKVSLISLQSIFRVHR